MTALFDAVVGLPSTIAGL
jgi:hypothetical protein